MSGLSIKCIEEFESDNKNKRERELIKASDKLAY